MATVYRVHKNKDYTAMCNHHLRSKELSLKGKGLLCVMLSLPEDWEYSINGIVAICKESKHTIESCLKELKDQRYLEIKKLKEEDGTFSYEYHIFEKPYPAPNFPGMENCPQSITNKSKEVFNKLNTSIKDLHTSNEFDDVASDVVVVEFPTKDKDTTYSLGEEKYFQYKLTFSKVDVMSELLKAKQWLIDNPRKRKTARGMPHFINNWLNRVSSSNKLTDISKVKSFEGISDKYET